MIAPQRGLAKRNPPFACGRMRTCKLGKRGLKAEAEWIEAHRKLFEARFEALDEIISEMKQEESDGSAS